MKTFPLLLLFLLLSVSEKVVRLRIICIFMADCAALPLAAIVLGRRGKRGAGVEREKGSGEETMGCVATQKYPFTTTPPPNGRKGK